MRAKQKLTGDLISHFNKLGTFHGLKTYACLEKAINNLGEDDLLPKIKSNLRVVLMEEGPEKHKKALDGALNDFRGKEAFELVMRAGLILSGYKDVIEGKNISNQQRIEFNMILNKPEAGVDVDCIDKFTGQKLAVQCKHFKDGEDTIIKVGDLSTFFSDAENYPQRMIYTNAKGIAKSLSNKDRLQVKDRSDLEKFWTPERLANLSRLIKDSAVVNPKKKTSNKSQKKALRQIKKGFKNHDRGQLTVPCGWGKTLEGLWISESSNYKKTLILCPSIALSGQILKEWHLNRKKKNVQHIVVCSDPSVAYELDAITYSKGEHPDFPVTTDIEVIKEITEGKDEYVIVCTYQSIQMIIDSGLEFDFGFFDEAHRTTVQSGNLFSKGLHDSNIKIGHRLFATATPRRPFSLNSEINLCSMANESLYGPVFYNMLFSEAVNDPEIPVRPVRLIGTTLTKEEVNRELVQRGITDVDNIDNVRTHWLANILTFVQAAKKHNLKKTFVYCNSVNAAKKLAGRDDDDIASIKYYFPEAEVFHVNGDMTAGERKRELDAFHKADTAIMTNVRCLTDGIDCPSVDCVAFFQPRKGVIDIVQATGRAMRKHGSRKCGYVFVPLFDQDFENGHQEDQYLSPYEVIRDVITALAEHNDELRLKLNVLYKLIGAESPRGEIQKALEDIVGIEGGHPVDYEDLMRSVCFKIVDVFKSHRKSTHSIYLGMCKVLFEERGDCNSYASPLNLKGRRKNHLVTKCGHSIYHVESNLRILKKANLLPQERIDELNAFKFSWDPEKTCFTANVKLMGALIKRYSHLESGYIKKAIEERNEWAGEYADYIDVEWVRSTINTRLFKFLKKYKETLEGKKNGYEKWQMNLIKKNIPIDGIAKYRRDKKVKLIEEYAKKSANVRFKGFALKEEYLRLEKFTGKILVHGKQKYRDVSIGAFIKRIILRGNNEDVKWLTNIGIYTGDVKKTKFDMKVYYINKYFKGELTNENEKNYAHNQSIILRSSKNLTRNEKSKLNKIGFYKKVNNKIPQSREKWLRNKKCSEKERREVLIAMGKRVGHTRLNNISELSQIEQNAITMARTKYKRGHYNEEDVAWYENNLPLWAWNERKATFRDKVLFCKQWFKDNPKKFPKRYDTTENTLPIILTKGKDINKPFPVGFFIDNLMVKEKKEWELAILNKELGAIWKKVAPHGCDSFSRGQS